jgi:HSP20 family protein
MLAARRKKVNIMVRPIGRHDGRESGLWEDLYSLPNRMTRLFEEMEEPTQAYPPVNIWAGDEEYVLTAELPGVESTHLDISVHGHTVTLQGTRYREQPGESENIRQKEREHGRFARSWRLPFTIDKDKVQARLQDGVLRLALPKSPNDKPKKIAIHTA